MPQSGSKKYKQIMYLYIYGKPFRYTSLPDLMQESLKLDLNF